MIDLDETVIRALPLLALSSVVALSVAIFSLPPLSRVAIRFGLIDQPSQRKSHDALKPLVGGMGMVFAVLLSLFLFIDLTDKAGLLTAVLALVIVGLIDDSRGLSCWSKFLVQVTAALTIVYWSRVSLSTFGDILSLGSIDFWGLSLPVTVFCIVGVINAFNMIDGADGLTGGVSLISFLSFTGLAALNGQPALMLLSGAMCGAVIGFLRFNWHPARLFMGDSGSLFLGCIAAFISIAVTQEGRGVVPPVAPLLILALPITDALVVILKRIARRRSPFQADRNHLHHIFFRLGLGARRSVVMILVISLLLSVVAITGTLYRIPEHYLFLCFSLYFVIHLWFSFSRDHVLGKKLSSHAVGETLSPSTTAIHEGECSSWQGLCDNRIQIPKSGLGNPVAVTAAEGEPPQRDCEYEFISGRQVFRQ
jgi:UDP-GlcNAc:undecaprenyl-phosphate/decaprenyl-phosphate GlcNAc-1-phosphate transferase